MPPIHPPLLTSNPLVSRPRPQPPRSYPKALLRLQFNDLSHPGAQLFLTKLNDLSTRLQNAVETVISNLYSPHSSAIPSTRSVTLVLRSMPGVAYTTGIELDSDHKEIHLSTDYIVALKTDVDHEITGVLVHEMVHCWQWNGCGAAPGGLIEGIADWVRLRAELEPPHWKKELKESWDAGYQHTAWFLKWVERKHGEGTVMRINEGLKGKKYDEKKFWKEVVGEEVDQLWKQYRKELRKELGEDEEVFTEAQKELIDAAVKKELDKVIKQIEAQIESEVPAPARTEDAQQVKVTAAPETEKAKHESQHSQAQRDSWVQVQEPDIDSDIPASGAPSSG